jgi:SH3-like domain-containing protein
VARERPMMETGWMSIVKHIPLGIALLLVVMTGSAAAEKVWTKGEASLRADADRESSRVALIQANRELTVIEKKGAWYRVKSGTKSGWIHRSSLRGGRTQERDRTDRTPLRDRAEDPSALDRAGSADAEPSPESAALAAGSGDDSGDPASPDKAKKPPKRICREGSVWCDGDGDAMRVVVVVSRVKAYKEPSEDEEIAFLATQDQELLVVGYHKPNWMYVQTLDGKLGWLKKDTVREKGNMANVRGGFFDEPKVPEGEGATDANRIEDRNQEVEEGSLLPEEPSRLHVRLGMGLGGALLGRTFVADNQDVANYETSSTAVVTTLSGDIRYQLSGAWHGGIDGNFSLIAALGGLTYDLGNQTLGVGNYVQHRTEVSAKLGYDVDSWAAYLRLGGLVEIFYINDLLNEAALPRERLISPTVGLQFGLRPMPKLELGLRGDVMLLGALAQTRGREDGDFDGLFAVIAQADALYALMERVALQASFRLDRVTPSWSGESVRAAGVVGASRTDQILRVLLGVQARF